MLVFLQHNPRCVLKFKISSEDDNFKVVLSDEWPEVRVTQVSTCVMTGRDNSEG